MMQEAENLCERGKPPWLCVAAPCEGVSTSLFVSVCVAAHVLTDSTGNGVDLLLGRLRLLHALLLLVEDQLDVARAGLVPWVLYGVGVGAHGVL